MGRRDEVVRSAETKDDRDLDIANLEAPRFRERDVVVNPAVNPVREAVDEMVADPREVLAIWSLVRLGHLVVVAEKIGAGRRARRSEHLGPFVLR